ncbi:MAG TPA: TetR/AcrR family transcriptional regulator [Acidimicrobiia bacterium]|nr:TetR/AcrR family transcriptional regulator [Acidimicrobiia bacterium]
MVRMTTVPSPDRAAPAGDGAPPLSRADRKVILQQNIVDAAVALTELHGVDGWTMQMLAAELGWSTGAAYRHLTGKDAILEAVAVEVLERVPIPEPSDQPWEDQLVTFARAMWQQLSKQRWVAQYLLAHPETGAFANRHFGAPLVAIFTAAGFDLDTVSLPLGLYSAFMFGSLCGFEAAPAAVRADGSRRNRRRRMKGYSADAHFEWGLTALVAAIRSQVPRS